MHVERENEGTSWYQTYWEQNTSIPSVTAICRKAGRHKFCSSWVLLLPSLIFHLFPSSECKTSYKYSSANINIQKNFYLNRSCLRQNTILTDRRMYLVVIWAQERWCGQIEVHYHSCVATCAYPAVSIPPFCNGFGALASKNSWRSVNNLTLLCGM